MALTQVNRGTSPNDNTASTLYDAFGVVNTNFSSLSNVDNTSDANKPISTATQNALNLKAPLASPTITGTLTAVNDAVINSLKVGRGAGNVFGNTVVGDTALSANTVGEANTALGFASLEKNQGGSGNTANGINSLKENVSGINNTAVGAGALQNSLLNDNTALGYLAGSNFTNLTNTTSIGYASQANASNQVTLGNGAITSLRCQVTSITSLSDERDKTDIVEITEGLDFVSKLKPVTFTWNQRDGNRIGLKSAGFIAQDLLELQNDSLIGENLDLVSDTDPLKLEARYNNLLPILVKAIQELTARINVLENK